MDECQKPDACPANSKCENTEGAFECNCKEGFQKNVYGACEGKYCLDVIIFLVGQHLGNTVLKGHN